MSDHPTPLKRCPTPWKHDYGTRGEALRGFIVAEYTRFHRPYRCCCGRWHVTSHPKPNVTTVGYSQATTIAGNGPDRLDDSTIHDGES